jgi:hypothetical protein
MSSTVALSTAASEGRGAPWRITMAGLGVVVALAAGVGTWQVLEARRTLRGELLEGNRVAARMASSAVGAELDGYLRLLQGFAGRPGLVEAVATGRWEEARLHLRDLRSLAPELGSAAVLDLWSRDPFDPTVVGQDFSFRDYFRAAVAAPGPYLSEVFRQRGPPGPWWWPCRPPSGTPRGGSWACSSPRSPSPP